MIDVILGKCGDANPQGNIAMHYEGGCGCEVGLSEAYRCVGCGGWFHRDCILRHFELEKKHDTGRNELRTKVISLVNDSGISESDRLPLVKRINKL